MKKGTMAGTSGGALKRALRRMPEELRTEGPVILAAAVTAALLAALLTLVLVKPVYVSKAGIYVSTEASADTAPAAGSGTDAGTTQAAESGAAAATAADQAASAITETAGGTTPAASDKSESDSDAKLVNNCLEITTGDDVLQAALASVTDAGIPYHTFAKHVTATAAKNAQVIYVKVSADDPYSAADLCEAVAEAAARQYSSVAKAGTVKIVSRANIPTSGSGVHAVRNGFLAGIAVIIAGVIAVFIFCMADRKLRTDSEIREILGLDTFCMIPKDPDELRSRVPEDMDEPENGSTGGAE